MLRKCVLSVIVVVVSVLVSFLVRVGASGKAVTGGSSSVVIPVVMGTQARPAYEWNFALGSPTVVPNTLDVPSYPIFPDGHIAVLWNGADQWLMFWAEFESYRTTGDGPYPENQTALSPATKVFGQRGGSGWDNGGSWLNSVFRLSGDNLVGFYHAEDHWTTLNPEYRAWKSIGVTYSFDNGITWTPGQRIITAWKTRPNTPEWGGAGDQSVIWDATNQRWVCFYQEQVENGEAQIHVAISYDPAGGSGTWLKWDGGGFAAPGLGGKGEAIAAFAERQGGNPSVHWNSYLGRWIMVYGGWDKIAYISASDDLVHWEVPRILTTSDQFNGLAWYPTIISEGGDTMAGRTARLYYADIADGYLSRKFYGRTITFTRHD